MMTNNQAEYRTLIERSGPLRELLGERASRTMVRVEGDSQLVLNQLGEHGKSNQEELKPLRTRRRVSAPDFGSIEFRWHPRDHSVRFLGH